MSIEPPPTDLDWVQLRKDMGGDGPQTESTSDKFARKFYENPFVPLGKTTFVY